MQTIVVLGSNSFGGACFVDEGLRQGYRVVGLSRSTEPHNLLLPYRDNPKVNQFTFHQLDINQDIERIVTLITAERPDFVVDFAGQGMVAPSWNWPEQWYQTNIVAKVRLHNALKDMAFIRRYVRVSTPEVYGDCNTLIDEAAPYNPSTPYAVSHAAIDMSLAAFHRQYGFPVILTRFANFYGPGQQLYRIVPRTILCALGNGTLCLHGGGVSVRAFIHGRDVAQGILRAMTHGTSGEAYHFSTDEFISIRELVEKIARKLGVTTDSFMRIAEDRPGKDQAYLMAASKAAGKLGWRPRYNLDTGLDECIAQFRDHLPILRSLPQDYVHKA